VEFNKNSIKIITIFGVRGILNFITFLKNFCNNLALLPVFMLEDMMNNATKYRFLIQQHKNLIYNYSFYMLKNKMDADDVTQEVFIRIWQNLGKFNLLAAKTWIMRVTHNRCLDYLRRRKTELNRSYFIDEEFEETVSDKVEINTPATKTHVAMLTSKVQDAIQELPENLRSIFVMYELHGLKYKEISKTLDLPLNTVKVNLLRARRKLQEGLKRYETE